MPTWHCILDIFDLSRRKNVLKLYYAEDQLDDANDKLTGGDGIADYKQVVIRFTSGANGSVSGKTTQVITLTNGDAHIGLEMAKMDMRFCL